MSEKEKRIKSITKIYYSNPKIQEAIFSFAKDREVVPSYMMESFGKRPDTLQYPSDIMGLVMKGATSFHASEEIWRDPLQIDSDLTPKELSGIRKSWDLLIDIDSPYLDCSKIAARLILEELDFQGVKSYGLKFSGSKGFHIIVPAEAFPEEFNESKTSDMFPDWPRAICGYLMSRIRSKYNKEVTLMGINFEALKERTNITKEDIVTIICPNCGENAKKSNLVHLECDSCSNIQIRPDHKITKRKLKCIDEVCPGLYEVKKEEELFACKACGYSSIDKTDFKEGRIVKHTIAAKESRTSREFEEQVSGEKLADLDLVLVAPRHLFRMPYSLHEKTALASVVLSKSELENFEPKNASPLNVKIKDFYIPAERGEALELLEKSITWAESQETEKETAFKKKYSNFEKIDVKNVPEELFPKPIKKLLKGLQEGRKRGFFVLLTFLRSLNFSPEYINVKIREWNKKNDPPLKEGYVRSQIEWHLKQKKQILPPNYKNDNFYKDLKLIDSYPKAKNPISEVLRKIRSNNPN